MNTGNKLISWILIIVCGVFVGTGCEYLPDWDKGHIDKDDKPSKEWCEEAGYENYGQCVREWAQGNFGPDDPINICENMQPGWIFCDDFESDEPLSERYFEYGDNNGDFIPVEGEGREGGTAMRALFQEGEVYAGDFKKSLGRTPDSYIGNHAVMPEEDFDEIYWSMDVRLQEGWTGGGGEKLTRAIVFVNSDWAQGLIAHLWSAGSDDYYLAMDPATGIDEEGNLAATSYNDFPNLRWLGAKVGTTPLFSSENAGKWYHVEAHIKLNTPGESNGIFEFWIDGELQAGSYDLNWHGTWNEDPENYMINAIFIENYWNEGSPAVQERYIDNFIISTERIGTFDNKYKN